MSSTFANLQAQAQQKLNEAYAFFDTTYQNTFGPEGSIWNPETVETIKQKVPEIFLLLGSLFAAFFRPIAFIAGCAVGIAENHFKTTLEAEVAKLAAKFIPVNNDEDSNIFSVFERNHFGGAVAAATLTVLSPWLASQGAAFYIGREAVRFGAEQAGFSTSTSSDSSHRRSQREFPMATTAFME